MIVAPEHIQAQLRVSAATVHETESIGPFTCFFNADDDAPWSNYAMPDRPESRDLSESIAQVVDCFEHWHRQPRFEFLADYAPSLADALESAGFVQADSNVLSACSAETLVPARTVEGLAIEEVAVEADAEAPIERLQDFVTVQGRAFAGDDRPRATREEAEKFRDRFSTVRIFLGCLNGTPIGAGSLTMAHDGLAEVAGIATLSAYRRRGVAAAMTEHIAREAFASGISALFLTAADEGAARVYCRVGFQPQGRALTYSYPQDI